MLTEAVRALNPGLDASGMVQIGGQPIDLNRYFALRKAAEDKHALLLAATVKLEHKRAELAQLKGCNLGGGSFESIEKWPPVLRNQLQRLEQECAVLVGDVAAAEPAWQAAKALESACAHWLKKSGVRLDHGHAAEGLGSGPVPLPVVKFQPGELPSGAREWRPDSGGLIR